MKIKEIFKAILLTFGYIFISEIVGGWILVPYHLGLYEIFLPFFPIISGIILLPVIYLITIKKTKQFLKVNFDNQISWIIFALTFGIIFPFIQWPLIKFYNLFIENGIDLKYDFEGYKKFTNITAINFFASIILVPIAEELFFRGIIQNNLQKKIKPIFAILISSLLFGLLHFKFENLIYNEPVYFQRSYIAIFGGIFLGTLFYKSKSLIPPILAHIFWNFMVIIV